MSRVRLPMTFRPEPDVRSETQTAIMRSTCAVRVATGQEGANAPLRGNHLNGDRSRGRGRTATRNQFPAEGFPSLGTGTTLLFTNWVYVPQSVSGAVPFGPNVPRQRRARRAAVCVHAQCSSESPTTFLLSVAPARAVNDQ